MQYTDLIGLKIIEVYETKPVITDGLFDSKAYYFEIIIQLEDKRKIILGPHRLETWKNKWWHLDRKLFKSKGTAWAKEHNLAYHNQEISQILTKNPGENSDGSLMIILSNGVTLEHLCANGDQLHIDRFEDIKNDWSI